LAATGDIIEVKMSWGWSSTIPEFINIFHYQNTGDPFFIDVDAVNAFFDAASETGEFVEVLLNALSSVVQILSVEMTNLDNPDDFALYVLPTPVAGDISGDSMPSFVAYGYTYERSTRATRNGAKRFVGVPEQSVSNGVIVPAAVFGVQAIAAALEVPVSFSVDAGIDNALTPTIVRKTGTFTYSATNLVSGVTYKRVTTQNSRKR